TRDLQPFALQRGQDVRHRGLWSLLSQPPGAGCLGFGFDAFPGDAYAGRAKEFRGRGRYHSPAGQQQFFMAVQHTPQPQGADNLRGPAQSLRCFGSDSMLVVAIHQSQTPSTIQRAGELSDPISCRAPAPSFDRITRVPVPAPRLSIASNGSPSSLPAVVSG